MPVLPLRLWAARNSLRAVCRNRSRPDLVPVPEAACNGRCGGSDPDRLLEGVGSGDPNTLINHRRVLREILLGRFEEGIQDAAELEDMLIHFTHARRLPKGQAAPQSHAALKNGDYIVAMEEQADDSDKGGLLRPYSALCELSHPASASLLWRWTMASTTRVVVAKEGERQALRSLVEQHRSAINLSAHLPYRIAILALRTLNRLPFKPVRTLAADAVLLGSAASPAALSRHLRMLRPMAAVLPPSLLPRHGWPAQLVARYFGADTPQAVAVFVSMLNDTDPGFLGWALRAISRWEPSPAHTVPVIRIHGSRDRLMLCGSDVDHVIDGAGHLLTITHAEQVNRALLDVLARAEGRATANR